MLRQQNVQISKPKRRRLYTPLSDDEENIENGFYEEKIVSKTFDPQNGKNNFSMSLIKEYKEDQDELAENFSWKMLKPKFRKDTVLLRSLWQYCYRFNSMEIANRMRMCKGLEKDNGDFDHIIDILTGKPANVKNNNQINGTLVKLDERKEEVGRSSQNRLYSVVEIREPDISNDFSNQTIQSTIKCDALKNIYTQHESLDIEKSRTLGKINNSLRGGFISSQFVDKSIIIIDDEINSGNQSKSLIDPNNFFKEWKIISPSKEITSSDFSLPSKISLLSDSSKKFSKKEPLSNCFL